ncbi:MAG: hypothetical protein RR728_08885, partial [Oscillospiraceae bacterium]
KYMHQFLFDFASKYRYNNDGNNSFQYLMEVVNMTSLDMHDFNFTDFNNIISTCEGDVYLVTDEGDRLNLKSKLCQLIGFTKLIEGARVTRARIECQNPADETKLFRFNLFGEK